MFSKCLGCDEPYKGHNKAEKVIKKQSKQIEKSRREVEKTQKALDDKMAAYNNAAFVSQAEQDELSAELKQYPEYQHDGGRRRADITACVCLLAVTVATAVLSSIRA